MNAQTTLRAALEKHGIKDEDVIYHSEAAILEAMEAYRVEAIEELEKWVKNEWDFFGGELPVVNRDTLKAKLAALKTKKA